MESNLLHIYAFPNLFKMHSSPVAFSSCTCLAPNFCRRNFNFHVQCQKAKQSVGKLGLRSNLIASGLTPKPTFSEQIAISKGEIESPSVVHKVNDVHEMATLVMSKNLNVLDKDTLILPQLQNLNFSKGLGIVEFLREKNFLVTGATGFFAKVLIEKILRIQPQVGKLYLLIKAADYQSAQQRIKNEIAQSDLFKCLRSIHGDGYEEFLSKKLIPVVGNISEERLGIQSDMGDLLFKEVNIVLNSAANTTFDERYDVALLTNTKGASNIMAFVRCCKNLNVVMHVSTAYVNGQRQGRVLEKPFRVGHSIAREKAHPLVQILYPELNIEDEFDLAHKTLSELLECKYGNSSDREKNLCQAMRDLGIKRARKYGWQDTYVFSKAMGEMMISQSRGDVPVVVVRPSVIESTYADPFPGWMEGNRMMDPIVLSYGKGHLKGFLADENGLLDVIPVDMVVNATLAAMARHANQADLVVYQIASSVVNPLSFTKLATLVSDHFLLNPYIDSKGNPIHVQKIKLFENVDDFVAYARAHATETPPNAGGNLEKARNMQSKVIGQAKELAKIYRPYTFYKGRFDNSNTEGLYQLMSDEERRLFDFDVKKICWEHYIRETHIPGLRQHVMKGRGSKTI